MNDFAWIAVIAALLMGVGAYLFGSAEMSERGATVAVSSLGAAVFLWFFTDLD